MPTFADGREILPSHVLQFSQGQSVYVTVPMAHNRRGKQMWADVLARVLIVDREQRRLRVRFLSGGLRGACSWEPMSMIRVAGRE